MSVRASVLLITGLLAATAEGATPPCTFARSGGQVVVAVSGERPDAPVVVRAFGRTWTALARPRNGRLRLEVPRVLRPTVFSLVTADAEERPVGELVAYPVESLLDVADAPHIVALAAPAWFTQWAHAVGLEVRLFEEADERPVPGSGPCPDVIVVGRRAAGDAPSSVQRLAGSERITVFVVEADWIPQVPGTVMVEAGQLTGPLRAVHEQDWRKPLVFRSAASPWQGIANRRAWIEENDQPRLEEIVTDDDRSIVVSLLPWQELLGRYEVADALLLAVLRAAARPRERTRLRRQLELLFPPRSMLEPGERPVLWAIEEDAGDTEGAAPLTVLDLRGDEIPAPILVKAARRLKAAFEAGQPILILGDDQWLGQCRWLELDRKSGRRDNLVWLPADGIPPDPVTRVRIMQLLTRWGVSLTPEEH